MVQVARRDAGTAETPLSTFMEALEAEGVNARNRDAHACALQRLGEFMRPRVPEQCTASDLRAFIGYLGELGVSVQSQGVYRSVLERWLRHLSQRPDLVPMADPDEIGAEDTVVDAEAVMPVHLDPGNDLVDADQTWPLNRPRPQVIQWMGLQPAAQPQGAAAAPTWVPPPEPVAPFEAPGPESAKFSFAVGHDVSEAQAQSFLPRPSVALEQSRQSVFTVETPAAEEFEAPRAWHEVRAVAPPAIPMARTETSETTQSLDAIQSIPLATSSIPLATPHSKPPKRPGASQGAAASGASPSMRAQSREPSFARRRSDEAAPSWCVRVDAGERGNLSLTGIRDLILQGAIAPHMYLKRPGGDWMRAAEYPSLRTVFLQAAELQALPQREARKTGDSPELDARVRAWGGTALALVLGIGAWWLAAMIAGGENGWAGLVVGLVVGSLVGTSLGAPSRENLSSRLITLAGCSAAALLASRYLVWETLDTGVVGISSTTASAFLLSKAAGIGLALAAAGSAIGGLVAWAFDGMGRR